MAIETVEEAPRTGRRVLPWVLLGVVVVAVALVVAFLRTPALSEGSFQNFPGAAVTPGLVAYGSTEAGEIHYVLSATNTSRLPVELVSAATDGSSLADASVDLGEPGAAISQAGVLNPGDEVRFLVRGTLPGCTADDVTFTTPVPPVLITYRQLGIDRVATISAAGHAILHTC